MMTLSEPGAHILVFPYPAQGHMLPLLDLTHQLALRNLIITILVTPKNLHHLSPLVTKHPASIHPLVLPFPANYSTLLAGVENVRDLPSSAFRFMMMALADLYDPIVDWFQNHPSPPVAIVSDMFLGWTHRLACELKISRFVFSPSGALALSFLYSLWWDMPKRNDPSDDNELIKFSEIPNRPSYPWLKIPLGYRNYVEGNPQSEAARDSFMGNIASHGLVINSFTDLEQVYLEYLPKFLGHVRIWAVGPLLPLEERIGRGGSTEILVDGINSWLDQFEEKTVVYVCFGSQAVLTNKQMEMLALGLENSGVKFLWAYKDPTRGHEAGEYGMIPSGFKDRVAGRGFIVKGWCPQVFILRHPAVGAFLTHCGWNSVLESIVAGVPMLTWPMGADQFANADLLDELELGTRVCEGEETIPDPDELGCLVARSVSDEKRVRITRAKEFSKAALDSIEKDGSSYRALNSLVTFFCNPKNICIDT